MHCNGSKFAIIVLSLSFCLSQCIRFSDIIIIFGDSNSDTGNAYRLGGFTWPASTPYYRGRFSNGQVRPDLLDVGQITNYAYGSATSDNNFVRGLFKNSSILVPGIRQQIESHMKKRSIELRSNSLDYLERWQRYPSECNAHAKRDCSKYFERS
jgi:hypothetical protein